MRKVPEKIAKLEENIYWLWQKTKNKAMGKDEEWNTKLHVTEIVYDCLRPPVFKALSKIPKSGFDKESMNVLWLGTCVHATNRIGEEGNNEIAMEVNGLYGQLDDLIRMDGEWVIVDKKTTRKEDLWKMDSASSHHVNQVNYYNYMLNKTKGITAKYGAIVYINPCSGAEEVRGFELRPLDVVALEVNDKIAIIKNAIKTKTLPPRARSWYCDYCSHFAECLATD